jgi:hypothetical protein
MLTRRGGMELRGRKSSPRTNKKYSHLQFVVERVALNMDQVRQYNPPPQPAKTTDSRAEKYIERFGNESWELDALEPSVLVDLVESKIAEYRDDTLYDAAIARRDETRGKIRDIATLI